MPQFVDEARRLPVQRVTTGKANGGKDIECSTAEGGTAVFMPPWCGRRVEG
jgi:hypothetical protein